MRIFSRAFTDGKPLPTKFAHPGVVGGKNISLPLQWEDIPEKTQSFALSIIDPHPVAHDWVHWLVVDIPKNIVTLPEGASPEGMPSAAKELYNSYGELGYGGPEPPPGSGPHPYVVTLFALRAATIDVSANSTWKAVQKALEDQIVATAKITGFYER